jgi:hypothetical protein
MIPRKVVVSQTTIDIKNEKIKDGLGAPPPDGPIRSPDAGIGWRALTLNRAVNGIIAPLVCCRPGAGGKISCVGADDNARGRAKGKYGSSTFSGNIPWLLV